MKKTLTDLFVNYLFVPLEYRLHKCRKCVCSLLCLQYLENCIRCSIIVKWTKEKSKHPIPIWNILLRVPEVLSSVVPFRAFHNVHGTTEFHSHPIKIKIQLKCFYLEKFCPTVQSVRIFS